MLDEVAFESACLACAFLNPQAAGEVAAELRPKMFVNPDHARIFEAITSCLEAGVPPGRLTVIKELALDAGDPLIGTIAAVGETFPIVEDLPTYIAAVKAAHKDRTTKELLTRAVKVIGTSEWPTEKVEAYLVERFARNSGSSEYRDVWRRLSDAYDIQQDETTSYPKLPWGALEDKIVFRGSGQLTVVGAPTSSLKSQFCVQTAKAFAEHGSKVLYVSLEMDAIQIYDRLCAMEGDFHLGVTPKMQHRRQTMTRSEFDDWIKVKRALPLIVEDSAYSLREIRLATLKASLGGRVRLVIVDYLQQVHVGGKFSANENSRLDHCMRALQRFSREQCLDMILVSQLNRGSVGKKILDLEASDLRGSGGIADKADQILFLKRETSTDPDSLEIGWYLYKDRRNGQEGTSATLAWDRKARALLG